MTKFKVGEKYSMFSPCQYSCTWEYEVVKRTEKSVFLKATDDTYKDKVCRLKTDANGEYCYPLGRYSMCPVPRAGR